MLHWIEVGAPAERVILKACGKAAQVSVLAYAASTPLWWAGVRDRLARSRNLRVLSVPAEQSCALAELAERSMQLQCSVQEGSVWIGDARRQVQLDLSELMAASSRDDRRHG